MCLRQGLTLADPRFVPFYTDQLYHRSGDEMVAVMPGLSTAIGNRGKWTRSVRRSPGVTGERGRVGREVEAKMKRARVAARALCRSGRNGDCRITPDPDRRQEIVSTACAWSGSTTRSLWSKSAARAACASFTTACAATMDRSTAAPPAGTPRAPRASAALAPATSEVRRDEPTIATA
jgi:hypothetical protein